MGAAHEPPRARQGRDRSLPRKRMNLAAANALLKTLEEPPPATYLILVSHQPGRVPATLRSRCRRMRGAAARRRRSRERGSRRRASPTPQPCWRRPAARRCWRWPGRPGVAGGARGVAAGAGEAGDAVAGGAGRAHRSGAEGRAQASGSGLAIDWLLAWTADLARVAAGGAAAAQSRFRRGACRPLAARGGADPAVSLSSVAAAAARAGRASAATAPRRRGAPHRLPRIVSLGRRSSMADRKVPPARTRRRRRAPRRAVAQHPRKGGAVRGVHAVPQGRRHLHSRRRANTRSARKCSCCCR